MTIDKLSWGHRTDAKLEDYLTTKELINGKTPIRAMINILICVNISRIGCNR